MTDINRREMLGGIVAGAAASSTIFGTSEAQAAESCPPKKCASCAQCGPKVPDNAAFYKSDGTFDVDKAKQAYYDMMKFYNYPIPPVLRTDQFWTLDFALGKFTEVGMAGILWINHLEHNYFGHEIYLLPGQMIAEHKHVKTDKCEPKCEGWHVRHGSIYVFGEGEPTPGVEKHIPPSHRTVAKSRNMKLLKPGETACLGAPLQWHFMKAGPKGAIVSEYATAHDMAGLRFSHPEVKL